MKPTIVKIKNMRGRVTGYRATLGQIEATGATAKEAVDECAKLAMMALENPGARLVLHDLYPDEHGIRATWILEFSLGGWCYRIARPCRPGDHVDGHSSCSINATDRYEAENAMRAHWYANNVEPFVRLLVAIGALASKER